MQVVKGRHQQAVERAEGGADLSEILSRHDTFLLCHRPLAQLAEFSQGQGEIDRLVLDVRGAVHRRLQGFRAVPGQIDDFRPDRFEFRTQQNLGGITIQHCLGFLIERLKLVVFIEQSLIALEQASRTLMGILTHLPQHGGRHPHHVGLGLVIDERFKKIGERTVGGGFLHRPLWLGRRRSGELP